MNFLSFLLGKKRGYNPRHKRTHTVAPLPLVYVVKDIERAVGSFPFNYYIVTTNSPLAQMYKSTYPERIFIVRPTSQVLNTYTLLQHQDTHDAIKEIQKKHGTQPDVIVFLNTERIRAYAESCGLKIANPSPSQSEKIEHKIRLVEWLGNDVDLLPEHRVGKLSALQPFKYPFILQWGLGHTGNNTETISDSSTFNAYVQKFPEREARITQIIHGPTITVNLVTDNRITHCGSPSYQITGLRPWTDTDWSTVGNDWALGAHLVHLYGELPFRRLVKRIAERMSNSGWHGLYGLDIVIDTEAPPEQRFKLIEINARQAASVTFESELARNHLRDIEQPTLFDLHIEALRSTEPRNSHKPHTLEFMPYIKNGAQLVQRITRDRALAPHIPHLTDHMYTWKIISYDNKEHLEDMLRVQTYGNFMTEHNKLSPEGLALKALLNKHINSEKL
jgi:hypothetical protein